ncbi:RNA 3'-terminal phosphate cyclase [Desulfovibrio sp. OttesenSCG-928-I05]|nr:RNA 3'-terminal phosphate cyclase [Desulfovibrio sp. OttesenSCG-928-I05]
MATPAYIAIDGSMGEGGGQVLRASLALSMALGEPFRMTKIRANRPKPGLKRQHLTCVKAAQTVCGAEVSGDAINSTELVFAPGPLCPGEYHFDVGSGGSVTLVLQALIPALMTAQSPSRITVTGGTHVPYAPAFEFMRDTLFPLLERMGPRLEASMERPGFMQVGGGRVSVTITPTGRLAPLHAETPGAFAGAEALIYCHGIPADIARREEETLLACGGPELGLGAEHIRWLDGKEKLPPEGPGNAVLLQIRHEKGVTVFGETGWRGRAAEAVARQTAKRALAFMRSGVAVERHLADQIIVPMALGAGGSFLTEKLTPHARTCLDIVQLFTDRPVMVGTVGTASKEGGKAIRVTIE